MKYKAGNRRRASEYEKALVEWWKKNRTFEKSVEQRDEDNSYVFYDGPPFITGMPHHGTLLSSIVKDAVPRYWTMRGKRVERRWGWDCHGLPAENFVEKQLGITDRREIDTDVFSERSATLKSVAAQSQGDKPSSFRCSTSPCSPSQIATSGKGVVKKISLEDYILKARESMVANSETWEGTIDRVGRWVDFKGAYRTMDKDFMESVWWAFKTLYEAGKIYEGRKVLMYDTKFATPVSKSEVTMDNDAYQTVTDPSAYVKFRLAEPSAILEAVDVTSGHRKSVSSRKSSTDVTVLTFAKQNFGEPGTSNASQITDGSASQVSMDAEVATGVNEVNVYFLAWTTTPWTLPANMVLAVNPEMEYAMVKLKDSSSPRISSSESASAPSSDAKSDSVRSSTLPRTSSEMTSSLDPEGGCVLILAKSRLEAVLKDVDYEVVKEGIKGSELIGLTYEPICATIEAEAKLKDTWTVLGGDFVSDVDGTGIVHIAPAYGEDDYKLSQEHEVDFVDVLDEYGYYLPEVAEKLHELGVRDTDERGIEIWAGNKFIAKCLEEKGIVWKIEYIKHEYPFNPRSKQRIMYRAFPSWFFDVQGQKELMLEQNENINWFPGYLKHGRFEKNIEQAPDWNLSRDRFWATAMPVWKGDKGTVKVVGSYDELEKLSGVRLEDYHRPWVDEVEFDIDGEHFKRIEKVLDCWFESGSMPFAQLHYPFENKEKFERNYPADFIVEYVGQVRAWFYYVHTVNTALAEVGAFGSDAGDKVLKRIVRPGFKKKTMNEDRLAVRAVCRDKDGRVALLHSKARGYYGLPGGGVEKGEEVIEAVQREVLEESGLDVEVGAKLGVVEATVTEGKGKEISYGYLVEIKAQNKTKFTDDEVGEKLEVIFADSLDDTIKIISENSDNGKAYPEAERDLAFLEAARVGKKLNAFKNVITTGTLAGNDGRKMSKSLGNYTDPNVLMDQYSADALRFLLLSSPVLSGEDFALTDKDVSDVARKLSMIWNVYDFFVTYAEVDGWDNEQARSYSLSSDSVDLSSSKESDPVQPENNPQTTNKVLPLVNPLDRWIISRLHQLKAEVMEGMEEYNIPKALAGVLPFVDDLSNWFVRRSRRRFWKSEDDGDKAEAYWTLWKVLSNLARVMAPFTPFLAEELWQKTVGGDDPEMSVHLQSFPTNVDVDEEILEQMARVREVINEGLRLRMYADEKEVQVKVRQPLAKLVYAREELPEWGIEIVKDEVNVKTVERGEKAWIDKELTDELRREGFVRELVRAVQAARKKAGLQVDDRIKLSVSCEVPEEWREMLMAETLVEELTRGENYAYDEIAKVGGENVTISLEKV